MEKTIEPAVYFTDASATDIPLIRALALAIWPVTYQHILSTEQLDYMLDLIYSEQALGEQMQQGHHFMLMYNKHQPIGFADYSPLSEQGVYKLHKIYVSTHQQGKGLGKILILKIMDEVKKKGAATLELNVNRYNKAKHFYEKMGFTVHKEVDIPIGQGYFMNDFVMRKSIK
jgi:diamine N-acetyltransferase